MRNDIHGLNEFDLSEFDLSEDRPRHTHRPAPTLGEAEETLCAEFVESYFTLTRPTMTHLYRNLLSRLSRENEYLARAGLPLLHVPSYSTFRRRIDAFPIAMTRAARHGVRRA